jgi:hypothetical protein
MGGTVRKCVAGFANLMNHYSIQLPQEPQACPGSSNMRRAFSPFVGLLFETKPSHQTHLTIPGLLAGFRPIHTSATPAQLPMAPAISHAAGSASTEGTMVKIAL